MENITFGQLIAALSCALVAIVCGVLLGEQMSNGDDE